MGVETDIGYADSTCNLMMGCDGCELWAPRLGIRRCYAGTLTTRRTSHGPVKGWPASFDQPTIFAERIEQALRWPDLTGTERPDKPWLNGLSRVVFLCDMGDPFTASLPLDWLAPFLPKIAASPHRWLLLTKRAARMRAFFDRHDCPPNLWPGVTVTSQKAMRRVGYLVRARVAHRWVSYEPAIGPVSFRWASWQPLSREPGGNPKGTNHLDGLRRLDWIAAGGASGHGAPAFSVKWLRAVVEECREAGVPLFVKQDSGPRPGQQGRIPDELWIKEFPR